MLTQKCHIYITYLLLYITIFKLFLQSSSFIINIQLLNIIFLSI
jgi:hypothetical protein